MALPNGAGGYQVGDGNVGEAQLFVQGAPTSITAAATMTAAQMANGLFVFDGTAGNLTLPTVADLEAAVSSAAKVNAAFDFFVVMLPHLVIARGLRPPVFKRTYHAKYQGCRRCV